MKNTKRKETAALPDDEHTEHVHGEGCCHHQEEIVVDEVDEVTVNEDDVNLLMNECKITKDEAIKALGKSENDVVSALVE
jgi:NACalpha-BTF3-like transcription factor